MGKIVSISNQKGGVGKTTTSINLSASVGILNKKVLVIDLDPQGNTTSGMGIDKRGIKLSAYDILEKDISLMIKELFFYDCFEEFCELNEITLELRLNKDDSTK